MNPGSRADPKRSTHAVIIETPAYLASVARQKKAKAIETRALLEALPADAIVCFAASLSMSPLSRTMGAAGPCGSGAVVCFPTASGARTWNAEEHAEDANNSKTTAKYWRSATNAFEQGGKRLSELEAVRLAFTLIPERGRGPPRHGPGHGHARGPPHARKDLAIFTDSQYVVGLLTGNYAEDGHSSSLIQAIRSDYNMACRYFNVHMHWVESPMNVTANALADRLAVEAIGAIEATRGHARVHADQRLAQGSDSGLLGSVPAVPAESKARERKVYTHEVYQPRGASHTYAGSCSKEWQADLDAVERGAMAANRTTLAVRLESEDGRASQEICVTEQSAHQCAHRMMLRYMRVEAGRKCECYPESGPKCIDKCGPCAVREADIAAMTLDPDIAAREFGRMCGYMRLVIQRLPMSCEPDDDDD